MTLSFEERPEALKHEAVKGVAVGECVEGKKWKKSCTAHAHYAGSGREFGGWLCFKGEEGLQNKVVQIHELAHLVAPRGHGERWRKAVLALGGSLEAVPGLLRSYEKRPRRFRHGVVRYFQVSHEVWMGQPTTASEKA
jgi:hypothetical protein